MHRRLVSVAATLCLCASSAAQPTVPIGDRVDKPLLPSGLSELPVYLSGQFAHIFEESDGTDVLHFLGDFELAIGEPGPGVTRQTARSREAVIWIEPREHDGVSYQQLQIMFWRDVRIVELGGTETSGPAMFVTLNTAGILTTHADDIAFRSTEDSEIYREGHRVRASLLETNMLGDERVGLRVVDVSGISLDRPTLRPRPIIQFRAPGEFVVRELGEGQRVLTVTGGVYLSRGVTGGEAFLELQADSVVVFLPKRREATDAESEQAVGLGVDRMPRPSDGFDRDRYAAAEGSDDVRDRQLMASALGEVEVESVYLEGDVRMSHGPNRVRATRVYYDLIRDRAAILDAVVRTSLLEERLPIYLRAAEIRQLSGSQFVASDAMLTTSEFHTPHYHIGASRVELTSRSGGLMETGTGVTGGSFKVHSATVNLMGTPVLYWPYLTGSVDVAEAATRGIRTGYSDEFGLELESDWNTFGVLGFETPQGFDSTLSLDFFSERGPAAGVDADYHRDRYFGEIRSYLMTDSDRDNLGQDRKPGSVHDVRSRVLLRHRQYLEDDWQLSLELSHISDRDFLEEFFESEFDNEKEQETLLYLKKQWDNQALTILLQTRLMDFVTQTERLPDFTYFLLGEPLGERLTLFSENRLGFVRYRPADQTFRELLLDGHRDGSGTVVRTDSRQELNAPLDVGPWRFVPFVSLRGTIWDDSPDAGGVTRGFGSYGVRGSVYLSKVDPGAQSELFDIDGIRHVIKPDVTAWMSHTNRDGDSLFPFDDTVEPLSEIDGVALGLRQRWQTKRGLGKTRRTVEFLSWDVELGVFNDADGEAITNGFASFSRPELSIARNYISSSVIWRINDRTALLSELNYDMNDGELDVLNVSLALERTPRLSFLLGYRFIEETESNLLGIDLNYRMTEKHTLAVRQAYDMHEGRTLDFTVALIRRFPHWFSALSFALDEAEDDFGVTVSIWPEGVPQATIGSRRFTGIADTARLQHN